MGVLRSIHSYKIAALLSTFFVLILRLPLGDKKHFKNAVIKYVHPEALAHINSRDSIRDSSDCALNTTYGSEIPCFGEGGRMRPPIPITTLKRSIVCTVVSEGNGLRKASAGQEASFTLRSYQNSSRVDRASFYARLVGPGIVGVEIIESPGGWNCYYIAPEPGVYRLEVILEFSHESYRKNKRNHDFYHDVKNSNKGLYEGLHIPGSPFKVFVDNAEGSQRPPPWCNPSHVNSGSWVLCEGQEGVVNIGNARWCWRTAQCSSLTLQDFDAARIQKCIGNMSLHFLILGDSVSAIQARGLRRTIAHSQVKWTIDEISIEHGLTSGRNGDGPGNLRNLRATMESFTRAISDDTIAIVVLNSGLHDAYIHMPGPLRNWDKKHSDMQNKGAFSPSVYRESLLSAKAIIEEFLTPNCLLVYRTTTSGWMVWGNTHADFRSDGKNLHEQRLWESPHVTRMLNDLANPLFNESRWALVDGYGPTYSRPDSMETGQDGEPVAGGHIHPTPDILNPVNAQILELMFETHCPLHLSSIRNTVRAHRLATRRQNESCVLGNSNPPPYRTLRVECEEAMHELGERWSMRPT